MAEKRQATLKMEADLESTQKLNQTNKYNFEDAFEATGHGRFNHIVLFTCGLILLNVSMESVGMSYAITAAECELKLNNTQKGLVNAAAFIGIISTSFLWGYLSDSLGRRKIMQPAIFLSAIFSIVSSFSTSVWMLIVFRILTGCLVSASSATVYAYLGEMHANSKRAAAIAWGSVPVSFCYIILPGLAWLMIPGKWSFTLASMEIVPWRAFVWLWCAPGLAASVILLFLPESPRFVLAAKGPDAALPILAKMYEWNYGRKAEEFPVKVITSDIEPINTGFKTAIKNVVVMFKPPLLKCVLIAHVSMFTVFMISSGLYMWVPDILNSVYNGNAGKEITICEIIHNKFLKAANASLSEHRSCEAEVSTAMFPISMAMGGVFALTFLIIGALINRLGRKTLYCGLMFLCAAATVGAAFVPEGISATILLVLALCSGAGSSIIAAIAVDVFPTSLRAMAMCVMNIVGRGGAAVGSYFLGLTLDSYCHEAFAAFGVFTAVTTILMLFWPKPEKIRREMEYKGYSY